jgi:hypothetical protein
MLPFTQPEGVSHLKEVADYKCLERVKYRDRIWPKGRVVRVRNSVAKQLLAEGKIMPLPKPHFVDIFKADMKLPETVTILGSGPKGIPAYEKIKPEDFVISLNGGLSCPVHSDLWMSMDATLPRQDYWNDLMLDHYKKWYMTGHDLGAASIGKGYPIPVMERVRIARLYPWVQLVFTLQIGAYREYMMSIRDVTPHSGYLRPGCTVCGAAIQMCFWNNVKHVRLCGIDMFGSIYADGSKHRKADRKDKAWGVVPVFNALMRYLETQGMRFTTLSETQLEIDSE